MAKDEKKGLRDKYKKQAVKLTDLKSKQNSEDQMIGYGGGNDYLDISEGSNKFKLFPPHSGNDFFLMRKVYWVDIPNDEGDVKRRTVYDSIVHGDTKKDIIQEYVKFVQKSVKDKAILDKITNWKDGLTPSFTWTAYALKLTKDKREFGLVDFKKSVRDALNKSMFAEDEEEPIEIDPYTDVDDGVAIIITYNSKPNKKKGEDYYALTLAKKPTALTDEELQIFEDSKSLTELYRGTYNLKEFDKALEALKYFDEANEIDLFEDDSWLEIVKSVKSQYNEDENDEDDEEDEKPKKKLDKKSDKKKSKPEPEDEDEEDEEGEEEKPKKKEKVKEKVKEKKKPKPEPEEEDEDEEEEEEKPKKKEKKKPEPEEEEDDEEEEEKPKKKSGMTMEEIRKKLGKK